MKLYELTDRYRVVDALLDDTDGEITDDIAAELATLDDALETKVDGIGALAREAEAEASALSTESIVLKVKSNRAKTRANSLKTYLLSQLKLMGRDKAKGVRFSARVATASTPSIRWEGPGDVPADFARVVVELDGRAAQQAEKAGTLPEGFTVTRTEYLDLR